MNDKNKIYLNLLSKEKNNIQLIDGFDNIINLILNNNKKFVIISDTFKDNIDFFIDLFPILKYADKIYYRELFNKKLDKNLYIEIYQELYAKYKKIIYFTYYIIVIDSLINKDIELHYINNNSNDIYYSIIKNQYNKLYYFKNYIELLDYYLEINIIDTLRALSIDIVNNANSGHIGSAVGCAPMLYVLWTKIMNYNPSDPLLYNRDRFILSNGHACVILYSLLYLLGYNYTLNDLKQFRQLHSITSGHPEYNQQLGIEISTGPLGQGIASSIGMAIASKKLKLNNKIYVLIGDGCIQEGITYEACSLAGHLGLNNLIVLYDNNKITIDGNIDLTFSENIKKRFVSQNWNYLQVLNGDTDINDIYNKLKLAQQSDKPVIISIHTTIGYGTLKSGTSLIHGNLLGKENTIEFKKTFNFNINKTFEINNDVKTFFDQLKDKKKSLYYNNDNKYLLNNNYNLLNVNYDLDLLKNNNKNYATRDLSNNCLNILDKYLYNIIIGSADLCESTKMLIESNYITKYNFSGKYIHFGIRENAMAAISNGLSTFGFIPIISTFLVFITYCLASIRMSALSKHKIIYILTHDSIWLGEDGPTHQPIESLTILRSIPNLLVFRPAYIDEIVEAYKIALNYNGPSSIILTRQTIPYIYTELNKDINKGAYIIYQHKNNKRKLYDTKINNIILVSTGSELSLSIDIAKELLDYNLTVISMVCMELFDKQDENYKKLILPNNSIKISIEAGSTICWYKYVDYAYGIDEFGHSGHIDDLKKYYKFTIDDIKQYILNIINNL
jgi:transketolase